MKYKLREGKRGDRKAMRSIENQKQNIKLARLKRTKRFCGGGLKKIGYDPKSVEKFGGVVGLVPNVTVVVAMLARPNPTTIFETSGSDNHRISTKNIMRLN